MEGNLPGNPQNPNNQNSPATDAGATGTQVPPQNSAQPVPPPQEPNVPPPAPPGTVPTQNQTSNASPPETSKGNGLKKIIILALVILILGGLVAGGYYMMSNMSPAPTGSAPATIITPAPADGNTVSDPAPAPTEELLTFTSEPVEGLSLSAYSMAYPASWTLEEESTPVSHTATLTKDGYSISISQAPTGGNFCVFEGELPDGPATDYRESEFVEINAPIGVLRRAGDAPSYSLCQESQQEAGTYFLPTSIGFITYELPANSDDAMISEMDGIIATLNTTE